MKEGVLEGVRVGSSEGIRVGSGLGGLVGDLLGREDVGDWEGESVGFTVGAQLQSWSVVFSNLQFPEEVALYMQEAPNVYTVSVGRE